MITYESFDINTLTVFLCDQEWLDKLTKKSIQIK